MQGARPGLQNPTGIVAALANQARENSVANLPAPAPSEAALAEHNPARFPCVHRSDKPIEQVACKPCMNLGLNRLPVYGCNLHGRCAITGASHEIEHKCITCADREQPKQVTRVKGLVFSRAGRPADHLADSMLGASAFLVGGGYSLAEHDLSKLTQRGVLVAAINQVGATHVRPKIWFSGDLAGRFHERLWRDPAVMKFAKRLRRDEIIKTWSDRSQKWVPTRTRVHDCPNVWLYEDAMSFSYEDFLSSPAVPFGRKDEVPDRPRKRSTKSTMFPALRLLYWLGVRRVFMLGVDFKMEAAKPYVFDEAGDQAKANTNNASYARIAVHLKNLRPLFEANGFHVWNCNPHSALEAFDHKPYEEALEQCALDDSGFVRGLYSYVE
jgi:hypothetical protein